MVQDYRASLVGVILLVSFQRWSIAVVDFNITQWPQFAGYHAEFGSSILRSGQLLEVMDKGMQAVKLQTIKSSDS